MVPAPAPSPARPSRTEERLLHLSGLRRPDLGRAHHTIPIEEKGESQEGPDLQSDSECLSPKGTLNSSSPAPTHSVDGGETAAPKEGVTPPRTNAREGQNADLSADVWPLVCAII